jgi:PKD repeat protein
LISFFLALGLAGCLPKNEGSFPLASFTIEPSPARAYDEVVFDASSSTGSIVLYQWDFGDGTEATGVRVTHIYTAEGTYTVRLTVSDEKGRQAQAEQILTVLAEENPPAPGGPRASFIAEPQEGEAPLTVTFDASSSTGDILSYTWNFGDGGTGSGVVVEHTYTAPGAYVARLTVRDREGREHSAERRILVHAVTPPSPGPLTAAFTFQPQRGPVPLTVAFDASGSTGQIAEYRWEFGDGGTATGKAVTHTYYEPKEYTVRLTVVGNDGRTAMAEGKVVAEPPLPPPPPSG